MWKPLLLSVLLVACEPAATAAPPPSSSPADPLAGIELPSVPTKLADPGGAPRLVVSKTAILLADKLVVALVNGQVDAADKEGGALGLRIPKLATALQTRTPQDSLELALDRATPYSLLVAALVTAKSKPLAFRRFTILARAQDTGAPTALLLALPDRAPALAGGARRAAGPNARISITDQTGSGDRSLTPDMVVSKIAAAYLAAIKRCYTAELARDATAQGTVKLSLSVDETGAATGAHADGLVEACITPQLQAWRFPKPAAAPASFTITIKMDMEGERPAAQLGGDADGSGRAPAHAPLLLVVSLTGTELLLWSTSGAEGTRQAPKLRVPSADPDPATKLQRALAEIAKRDFGGTVPPDQRQIVFQATPELTAGTFVPVMAAMRSVFPDILVSAGLE